MADFLLVALVDLVLDGLLVPGFIDVLLELFVLTLKRCERVQGFVQSILHLFYQVSVSLDHDLLDLVFLDALVESILSGAFEWRQLVESVRPSLHVETFQWDSKLLPHCRVINISDTFGLLLKKLVLGCLYLASKHHQSPNKISHQSVSKHRVNVVGV